MKKPSRTHYNGAEQIREALTKPPVVLIPQVFPEMPQLSLDANKFFPRTIQKLELVLAGAPQY